MELEYKTAQFELKDADPKQGIISGYAGVFGNVDDGLDVIEHGAFTKTLQERGPRIKACYGHDLLKLVGVPMEIREDDNGLYTVTKLALQSFWGKEVHALSTTVNNEGIAALNEMSIGYMPVQAAYDPDNGLRRLRELKLYEYSFVPIGMNDRANVLDAKSLLRALATKGTEHEGQAELIASLAEAFREFKAGKVLSGKNRELISTARDTLAALLAATEPDAAKAAHHSNGLDEIARAETLRAMQLRRLALNMG